MLFAALQLAANAAILNHLANVEVTIGDATVPGIFRSPAAVASVGVGAATTAPVVSVASSAVMPEPYGQVIEIREITGKTQRYAIGEASPDDSGLTVLTLEIAQ